LRFYGKNFSDLKLVEEPPGLTGKLTEVDFKYSWGGKRCFAKLYLQYDAKKLLSAERKWNIDAILSSLIVRGERREEITPELIADTLQPAVLDVLPVQELAENREIS
jgi:hypothetical protein